MTATESWKSDIPEPKHPGDLLAISRKVYEAYAKELKGRSVNVPQFILFKSMLIALLWRYKKYSARKMMHHNFHEDLERALNRITEMNYARHYKKKEKFKEIMDDIGGAMNALIEDCSKRGQHPDGFSIEY